ncbi:MAG TPA: AAA family ATPase [Mycobacteriales bacterium]|nr:AAA family ATPase [Mycobacteriales bacterium]
MITRIEIYNYRCFPVLSVDVDRYQVLAGTNGAGKTTLLDIPALLGDLVRGQRAGDTFLRRPDPQHAPRATTLAELLFQGRGHSFGFSVEARLPADIETMLADTTVTRAQRFAPTHLRYELRLDVFNDELTVGEEYLFLFSDRGRRPEPGVMLQGASIGPRHPWRSVIARPPDTALLPPATLFAPETTSRVRRIPELRVPPGQPALGAVPADPTLFPAALWLADLLREGVVFFDPDWTALRQAAPPGDPPRLLPSARNTPWLALNLQAEHPDRCASWVDHVRTALPQVEQISAQEREEDHHAYFSVEYSGGYRVTSSGLSDGTLRILALTLLPYLMPSAVPRLLITEEPENGIHPRAIETVVQSLNSLYDSQVWVSTHSPIVLAHTDLGDVLAARLNGDGGVEVVPGDQHPRLRDWQGSLDIGTLFAAGVLS